MSAGRHQLLALSMFMTGFLLLGAGCVKIDATVNVERDGRGSLRAIYGMPTHVVKQAELALKLSRSLDLAKGISNSTLPELDIPYLYSEPVLKAKFDAMSSEGVVLESLKTREQGGWNYVDFTLKFISLEALFKQSFFSDCGVVLKHLDEKSCKLTISLPQVGVTPERVGLVTQESLNKLTPFFNGFRVVTRLGVPGEIRNSNSLMSDRHWATWEWDFDKDSMALARLAQDKMIIVFDATDFRVKDFEKSRAPKFLSEK